MRAPRRGTAIAYAALPCAAAAVCALHLASAAGAPDLLQAGIVTELEGRADVVHASLATPAALHRQDPVFVRDRIATADRSTVRLLLGGRAAVTIREHSRLLITEAAGTARLDVSDGKIGMYAMHRSMSRGETIEIYTPNVVIGVRGTVLTAEVEGDAAADRTSSVTVLQGVVSVTHRDPVTGQLAGAPVTVRQHERVSATRAGISKPVRVRADAIRRMANEFRLTGPHLRTDAARAAALRWDAHSWGRRSGRHASSSGDGAAAGARAGRSSAALHRRQVVDNGPTGDAESEPRQLGNDRTDGRQHPRSVRARRPRAGAAR